MELIGKLVTRGPRNRSDVGSDRMVLEDLLIALGWIHKKHVSDGLLAKYTLTGEIPESLVDALKTRWRLASADYKLTDTQFDALCRLAIAEHFDPKRCSHCQGQMEYFVWTKGKHKRVVCPTCLGTGVMPFPTKTRSKAIKIDVKTWHRRDLETLYMRMLVCLGSWESYGRRRIAKALRRT